MADPEQLARLKYSVTDWNLWRKANLELRIDLTEAELPSANLKYADLRDADLTNALLSGSNLRVAKLEGAVLIGADLVQADFRWAYCEGARFTGANLKWSDLSDARFAGADLREVNLWRAKCNRVDLSGANLSSANLSGADLSKAKLTAACLFQSNLKSAYLAAADATAADLREVDLRSATLQWTNLTSANLSRAKVWEIQKGGWIVKNISCDAAFWDRNGTAETRYLEGEFERLYSDSASIELFYKGGVSTFELSTLPALLQHLVSLHPSERIRLKSIEETGGGAKISILVDGADTVTLAKVAVDAEKVHAAQLALRDDELNRLKIQKEYIETLLLSKLIPAVLTAGTPQNVFNAPFSGNLISGANAPVQVQQSIRNDSNVMRVIEKMMSQRGDLNLPAHESLRLEAELQALKDQLGKPKPEKSFIQKGVDVIEKIATEALLKGAEKLGEKVVSDWPQWLHDLTQHAHHLG